MSRPVARLMAGLVASALGLWVQVARAQETPYQTFHASYALWGMMDAVANFCWEQANYYVSYMEMHQDWLARNVMVRDELDAALTSSGEPDSAAVDGEGFGKSGILKILEGAPNKAEACAKWKTNMVAGAYEAEAFLGHQLGLLRERDGM